MNPGAAAAWWCGYCCMERTKVWMCGCATAKISALASESFSPDFPPCLLSLHFCLGTFVSCVPGQGQKSRSSGRHDLPPGSLLSGTCSWSRVARAVTPQERVTLSRAFSEVRVGFFSPWAEKKAVREKLLNRKSISGKDGKEACVAGGRLGLRLLGFPEAVGCGKRCG